MQRPLLAALAASLLASLVLFGGAGCGGGGRGGSNGSSGTTGKTDEVVTVLAPVALSSADSVTSRSLANTVVGESLVVRALRVTTSGSSFVTLSRLSTNAPASVAVVDAGTGTLTAVGASNALYTVTGQYAGQTLTAPFQVSSAGTRTSYSGVARTDTGAAVVGARVSFYGPAGTTALATTLVGQNGAYQANVPVDATRFVVDASYLTTLSGKPTYYDTALYQGEYFDSSVACYALLPNPGIGGSVSDYVFFFQSSGTVPSPPNGCVAG